MTFDIVSIPLYPATALSAIIFFFNFATLLGKYLFLIVLAWMSLIISEIKHSVL